jgi:uncharacterized protein
MNNSLFKALRPGTKLLLFMSLIVVGFSIGSAVLSLVAMGVWKLDLHSLQAMMTHPGPADIEPLKWLNNIAQTFGFLIPVLVFLQIFGKKDVNGLMWFKPATIFILAPLWIMLSNGVIDLLGMFNHWIIPAGSAMEAAFKPSEDQAADITQMILSSQGLVPILTTVISVAIIPAVFEELVFRGVVQPLLARSTQRIHLSIWLTAALFSAIHMQFYGFIPRLFLGAMMGYLVIWSGSLWTSIIAHLFNNLMAIVIFNNNGHQLETSGAETATDWAIYAVSIVALVGLAIVFVRNSRWPWIGFSYLGITDSDPSTPPPSEDPQAS